MGAKRVAAASATGALLLAAGCASFTVPPADRALSSDDAAKARALAHFAQGLVFEWERNPDLEAALRAYEAALAEDPRDPDLRNMAARVHLDLKRPEQAQAILERAVRDLPTSAASHLALGRVAASRGNHPLAAREFRLAAKHAATPLARIEAELLATYAAFLQDADRDAFRSLDAVASSPDRLAVSDAEDETALTPRIRAVRFALELAELRLDARRAETARPYAEWAAARATNATERADVWERFGGNAWNKRQPEAAAAALREATRHDPLRSRAALLALAAERRLKFHDVTPEVLAEAIADRPDDAGLRIALARLLAEQNRHADATGHVEAAIAAERRRHPDAKLAPELWLLRGSTLERSGDLKRSEAIFREALAEHPDFAPIQNYLAYMLAEQNRELEEAERLVVAALKTEPRNPAYLDTLGWVHHQAGRHAEALVWLMRAAEDEAQDATTLDHIGDTLEKLGRKPESASYWAMSYRLDPDNEKVAAKLTGMGVDLSRLRPITPDAAPGDAPAGEDDRTAHDAANET